MPDHDAEVAAVLRNADFALDRVAVALIAFIPAHHAKSVSRDFDRCQEVRRQIAAALEHLPAKPPLSPEREAECREIMGRVVERMHPDA